MQEPQVSASLTWFEQDLTRLVDDLLQHNAASPFD
ncbi:hypothetical protein QMY54_00212 (plasmid) [Pseudomonas rhodesiae]|jgi:hypothetical protein|nr:hypothetical protein QMY54_00212 [Pseudomonas rhodesiae]